MLVTGGREPGGRGGGADRRGGSIGDCWARISFEVQLYCRWQPPLALLEYRFHAREVTTQVDNQVYEMVFYTEVHIHLFLFSNTFTKIVINRFIVYCFYPLSC